MSVNRYHVTQFMHNILEQKYIPENVFICTETFEKNVLTGVFFLFRIEFGINLCSPLYARANITS